MLVLSDLHLEFAEFAVSPEVVSHAEVVVLAGDIHKSTRAYPWMSRSFAGKPVVYVAGNHEFYSQDWRSTLVDLRSEAIARGVHFLEDTSEVIQGVRFLGCSLWTDFSFFGDASQADAMRDFAAGLNDCRQIRVEEPGSSSARQLVPGDILQRHLSSRRWLEEQLHIPFPGKTVVVTHHLPHANSVAERYRSDRLTPGFASRLPEPMLTAADLWIHGHSHDSSDYTIESGNRSVRVVCNPRGYPTRGGASVENKSFVPDLIIEI